MKKYITNLAVAKKLGMTRIFDKKGKSLPVTVLEKIEAQVVKSDDTSGRVEIAYLPKKKTNQPTIGRLKQNNLPDNLSQFIGFKLKEGAKYAPGDKLSLEQFKPDDRISVISRSRGKGFQGVIKRHGFSRGPETHGSHHHRAPGSIGSMFPQRVIKGKKMPGRLGARTTTIKKLIIADIDLEKNLLIVKGSIAGPNRSIVFIYK